jgi:hypothetical protein
MDELNLDLDNIQEDAENKLKVKNRFEQLSEKVILTSKEKDEANAKANAEAERASNAEKERDFYKDFSQNITRFPAAAEYQSQIFEKVKGGLSTEDATFLVLGKEGKLGGTIAPITAPTAQVEGGSASTTFEGAKTVGEMSIDEKKNALMELEKSGDLQSLLKRGVTL